MSWEYELRGQSGWQEVGEGKSARRWAGRGLGSEVHSSTAPTAKPAHRVPARGTM